jgi:hypothetical protein
METFSPDWNGIHRWHIEVDHSKKIVDVYLLEKEDFDYYSKNLYEFSNFLRFSFIQIWIGSGDHCDGTREGHRGNTILLQESPTCYVWIGNQLLWFTSDEQVVDYHSPVCSNGTPFPFALTSSWVILPVNLCRYPRSIYEAHPEFKDDAHCLFHIEPSVKETGEPISYTT